MKTLIKTTLLLLFTSIIIQGCSKEKSNNYEDLAKETDLNALIKKCENYRKDIHKILSAKDAKSVAYGNKEAFENLKKLQDVCSDNIRRIKNNGANSTP